MEPQQVLDPGKSARDNEELLQKIDQLGARWLRIFWCDYSADIRCRLIPISLIKTKLTRNEPVTLTMPKASLGLLPDDHLLPGMAGVGGYHMIPDWASLQPGPTHGQLTCVGEFHQKDGSPVALCPRTVLRTALETAAKHGLEFILGFEIEFTVMELDPNGGHYVTVRNDGHQWSTARNLADWGRAGSFNSVLDELVDELASANISIEQLHTESAPGQYEIALTALPALQACDSYFLARQIIEAVAARHGFRVTLHPKLFPDRPGNATHVHMSISSAGGNDARLYEPFYAGILAHLRAVTAFTYASPVSYERLSDSNWAGGRWVTWGTENREAPLRKCLDGHWEFRLLDGMANLYLALAAVLSAGTAGVEQEMKLSAWEECLDDPAVMSEGQRKDHGIVEQLPGSLSEALDVLRASQTFSKLIDETVIERHITVKEAEIATLESMDEPDRRQWIIARF